jgi:LEA14-like dessication related protein
MLRTTALVILCILATGCAQMTMEKPTAKIAKMSVQDINSSGFTMNFGVDVHNPNSKALPIKAADYKLMLSGTKVLEGKAKPEEAIPAGGTKQIQVPVTLSYDNLLAAKSAILKSGGNLSYALDGGLSFDAGGMFGSLRTPMKYSGELPVADLVKNPMALLKNPALLNLAKALMSSFSNQ